MTQAFSLYGELTVAQNLELHAQLYHLPPEKVAGRIEELLERYDLKSVVNARPDSLPLGIKQRLQLAVAVLHEPSILILDEPTSGVDPIARDSFWRTLIDLSRDDGVTIFVTTHFMNEADRCDRISLMHAGKVLAVGAPQELVKERGSASLEDCFVGYLAEAAGIDMSKKAEAPAADAPPKSRRAQRAEALQLGAALGLRAARDGRAAARPDPAGLRARRPDHPHVRLRLRHLVRHRELGRPRLRPGRHAPEPRPAPGLRRIALFRRPASDHVGGRDGAAAQERKHPDRGRSAARFRPRPSQRPHAGGRRDGRWRHDVPWRNGEELRDRVVRKQGEELQRSLHRPGSANAWS